MPLFHLKHLHTSSIAKLPNEVPIPATIGTTPLQLIEDEEYYLRKLKEVQEAK